MRSALSALLPGPSETALLQACLGDGTAARVGWDTWRRGHADSMADLRRVMSSWRTLLPLLEHSASRNALDLGKDLRAFARAAKVREERRAARFRELASGALRALERGGIQAAAVRGAPLAARVYDEWSLRHCHDLDLLIEPDALHEASDVLTRSAFRKSASDRTKGDVVVEHESGMQISLHTRPFALDAYHDHGHVFMRDFQSVAIGEAEVHTPSPEATLVHVLGHASYASSRRNLRWVADAWHLVTRSRIDWNDVRARIVAHRLELPLSILLDYLAAFGMAIPTELRIDLRDRAIRSGRLAQDVALGGAVASMRGAVSGLWHSADGWRERLQIVRWAALPTPSYMSATFGVSSAWLVPFYYLYRPARFLTGRILRDARTPVVERDAADLA